LHKPPLVERAEAEGLAAEPAVGALAHVLAAERGRARVGTTIPALAPWMAAALAPGVPLYVAGGARIDDPDVHSVDALEPEAPFDFLAVEGEVDATGLLVPGGLALLVGGAPAPGGLIAVEVGDGVTLAVRSL
jgi:hypothetical protein